mgnify:CR=1 FL=1|tara:strand:- start:2560 stop:3378 length:819 start_codon:yes stop_codon:yes gene_type:complete
MMTEKQRKQAYGGRVQVPDFTRKDLGDAVGRAITSGKDYLSQAADLGRGITEAQQDILEGIMSRVPGLDELRAGVPTAISSMVKGEIPQQVADQISRSMAGVGLMGGLGKGSGALKNLTAQKLGVSSLGLIQQGISAAQGWLNTSSQFMARPFDIAQSFIPTSQQFHAADTAERDSAFNVALAQAEQVAAPDPYAAANEQMRLLQAGRSQALSMMPMSANGPVRSWQQGLSGLASRSAGADLGGMAGRRYGYGDRLGAPTGYTGSPVSFSNF